MVEINLRQTAQGMPCEEYSLLVIAGPSSRNLPQPVQERMNMHLETCGYHNGQVFNDSALGTPVTPELEAAASEIVAKYSK